MRTKILCRVLMPLFLMCSNLSFAQGGESLTAPGAGISLPFSAAGTTIGTTNDVNDPGTTFDDGPDWVYMYCPAVTTTVYVTVQFTPGGIATPVYPSISAYYFNTLTSSWTLLAQGAVNGDTDPSVGIPYNIPAGLCVYFVVDNNSGGFNYNINITSTPLPTQVLPTQPGCTNMGFDNGTTSGWTGNWGHSIVNGLAGAQTPIYTPILGTTNAGHHNVTTPGLDAYLGAIQEVCPLIPGNTNSMMLGDGPNASYGGAQLMQKFSVTASNALLTYYYAAVMQDAGSDHANFEQPFFKIEALDCAGNPIVCGNYLVTGGPGIPGFIQVGTTSVYYRDWTPVMLDLTPYIGSCVTIKFTVGDCARGAHFAYAYLDATCGPMSIVAPPSVCQFQTSTLTAPAGAATYSWVNTAAPGTVLGTANTLSITPTTTGTFTYQCTMTSVTGCNSTLTSTVTVLPTPQITVTNPPAVCSPSTVDLTSASVVTINSGTGTIGYFSDAACTVPIASPNTISVSGTYYIRILNANGCYEIEPVTVVVNSTPTVNVTTADQTICIGQSVNLNATISPTGTNIPVTFTNTTDFNIIDGSVTPTNSTISVTGITPQTAGVLPIVSVNVNINHTYDQDLTIWLICPNGSTIDLSSDNGGSGQNYTNTAFVPSGSPSITTGTAPFTGNFTPEQAFSLLNGCGVNGTWTLQVYDLATGDVGTLLDWSITFNNFVPTTYAWSPTSAMTGSTTLTPIVTPTATTTYTFTGTSATGGCTASDPVTITVNPLPTATIGSNATVCQNAAAPTITFTGANGTAPYTFTYNINGGANQTVSSGAGTTATVTAPTATAGTFTYSLVSVTSAMGCSQNQSGTAVITVNPTPTVNAPASQTVCANATTTAIAFTGNNTATTTFNWTNNTTSIGLGGSGTGTIAAFTATNATASPVVATITVTPTLNGCVGTPQNFTITVNPIPTVNAPTPQTVCANATTTAVAFTGNNTATTTFNWTNNTTSIGLGGSGSGTIAAFTATNATASPVVATITVTPTLSGCTGTPQNFTITVNPIPTVNAPTPQTVCANATTTAVAFTGNNTATTTFNWTNNTTSIGLGGSGTGNIAAFTATNATASPVVATITVTPTLNSCVGTPQNFTITVNPIPTVNAPTSQTVCANTTTTAVAFTGNNTATTTFNWTNNTTSIGLGGSGSGTIAAFTATNATASPVVATITVTPTLNSCVGTPQNFTITVNPTPTVNAPTPQTVCANATTTAVAFTGNNTATTTFNWTNNTTSIGLGGSGTGTIAAFTATNATASPVVATITVTPTLNSCVGTPQNFTITVNPIPTVNAPTPQTVCANATTTAVAFTGNNTATTTFNWTNNTTSIGLGASGSGTIAAFTATNATASPVVATITVTPTLNSCVGTPQNFTITVNPSPTIGGVFTACAGSTTQLTGSGTPAAVTPWTSSNTAVATISSTGLVTGVAPGTSTITYTNSNGCSATQAVTITSGATISGNLTVCVGATTQLTGSGTANATNPWVSSNTAVATVSNTGLVTSVSAGTTTITYTNSSGCLDNQIVTVNPLPTVSGSDVCIGGTTQLTGSGTANATNPWVSSNTAVATINATGLVTGVSAGSTTITYTNSNGCSNTMTLNVVGNPAISGTLSACVGATTQLSATGTPNAINPWTSSNTAVATVSNTGLVTGISAGTATITFTNSSSCQSTAVVTINPLPTITGTLNVCAGSTTQLTGSPTANATTPWTSSNTAIATVSNTGLVTGVSAGTSTITYVNSNGCSITAVVTVNPLPTATIAGASTICAGSTASFTISGTPNATVVYSNGASNSNVVLNAAGNATVNTGVLNTTTTYTLVSAQSAAPASCSNTLTGSVTITVNPIPVMNPVANTVVCPGDNVVIPVFASNPTGATYAWTNTNTAIGLGASGNGDIPTFVALNAGTTPISGSVTVIPTLNGCIGSSVTFTIGVSNNPSANAGVDIGLCINSLTGNQIGSASVVGNTYLWNPATNLSNAAISNPTVNTTTAGTTQYTVTVTNALGCQSTDVVSVTINPLPIVSFNSPVASGCAPVSISFTNASANSVNCVWTFEGGGTQVGCGSVSQQYNSAGVFDVTLTITDGNGCTNSLTNPGMITIYPEVNASFGVNVYEQSVLYPVFDFTNTSTNATSYSWEFGDGATSNQTSPSHTYAETPGVYHIILYASNAAGCNDSAVAVVSVIDELIFYVPNSFTPDGDEHNNVFFPVFSSGFDGQNYTLLIFDRWGEVIFESHNVEFGWDGTYIGQLCKEGTYTWKILIKERNKDKHHEYVGHVNLFK
ncbi:Ig-like domain-containing protein [Fluviicola taffensis]|uniref:Ig-like domain-containing protein n=1 Tax=Fluviicola taffensis TaxID=191579 RepID=UPI00313785BD